MIHNMHHAWNETHLKINDASYIYEMESSYVFIIYIFIFFVLHLDTRFINLIDLFFTYMYNLSDIFCF